MFFRGKDNGIYSQRFKGGSWSAVKQVPGGGATTSAPTAVRYSGSLYVFVRGTDDRIYVNRFTS